MSRTHLDFCPPATSPVRKLLQTQGGQRRVGWRSVVRFVKCGCTRATLNYSEQAMGYNKRRGVIKRGFSTLFPGPAFILLELMTLGEITRLDVALCSYAMRHMWLEALELFSQDATLHHWHICHGPSGSLPPQAVSRESLYKNHDSLNAPVWHLKDESELSWVATRMPRYRSLILVNDLGYSPIPCAYYSELHYAARRFDDPSIVRLLARRKGAVDIDTQDHFGRTPLHIACQYGNQWAARALVELGASVHVLNSYGFTPEGSGYANGHRFALYEPICEDNFKRKECMKRRKKMTEKVLFPSISPRFCYY